MYLWAEILQETPLKFQRFRITLLWTVEMILSSDRNDKTLIKVDNRYDKTLVSDESETRFIRNPHSVTINSKLSNCIIYYFFSENDKNAARL